MPCLLSLSLSDCPQDSGGALSLSPFFCILIYLLSSPVFLSLPPISVSHHFLGTLPWGSRSPVCRKPDPHHLFFIFWKRQLHFLPEGSGGGGAGCLTPPPSFPSSFSEPSPPPAPAPGGTDPGFPCGTKNQALIHVSPSAAHRRVAVGQRGLF